MKETKWEALRSKIQADMTRALGDEKRALEYTDEMMRALREFYSIYDGGLVDWFAGLYEPSIRFDSEDKVLAERYSGGAGFYYSNSARDNYSVERDGNTYQLLPDAETTSQVFGFLSRSGMLDEACGDIRAAFPDGEPEKIIRFLKALQDERTGYFYHPQWLSMLGTPNYWDSRQSRDLTYAVSALSKLGSAPTYRTLTGKKGDGIRYDGVRIDTACEADGSKVGEGEKQTSYVHPRLESTESFAEYLKTLNLAGNSYFVGNELTALSGQILHRDKQLATEDNPRPLATMLINWLNENQIAEKGYWHDDVKNPPSSPYYATNGLLKIATLYNNLKMPFPNPLPAARSAFNVITSDVPINHVCDLYNTWFIVVMMAINLRQYSGNPALADEIIAGIRLEAIPAVYATAKKMRAHRKGDGSFSYFANRSSFTSQNAPVAIKDTNEGDVNATVIFTYGILGFMFEALDFGEPIPICDDSDRIKFKRLIEEKIKNQ